MTKFPRIKPTIGLLVAALWTAAPIMAGVVYEIDVTDHSGSQPESDKVQTSVQDRQMKVKTGSGRDDSEMIYRADSREMVVIDHDDRSYMVIDEATIAELGAKLNEASRMMEQALKDVPPEQRPMVERMMKQRMPQMQNTAPARSPTQLNKTGERATHNGYPCVKYEVLREGRLIRELWVTDWDNVEGGDEVIEMFRGMADFFSEMIETFPKMGPGGVQADENLFEYMNQLDGFPVLTRELEADGSLEGESVLRSAERRTLDPAEFEPPKGYKRRSMVPR